MRSSFGVEDCHYNQWGADDWHPDYVGAPAGAVAWMDGDACGVMRMGFRFDAFEAGDEVLLDALAATRYRGEFDCCVRLATDM